jgi:hypothetical protein
MRDTEFEKPKVKLFLSNSNPLRCCGLGYRNCIAHPIIKVLKEEELLEKAEEFRKEYVGMHNREKDSIGCHGIIRIQEPFYYGEFFELALKYVDLDMYEDFRREAEQSDEELRRRNPPTPFY